MTQTITDSSQFNLILCCCFSFSFLLSFVRLCMAHTTAVAAGISNCSFRNDILVKRSVESKISTWSDVNEVQNSSAVFFRFKYPD